MQREELRSEFTKETGISMKNIVINGAHLTYIEWLENILQRDGTDKQPKHLHIIPCDFCDNNRTVIDGKNYCDSCYEKRYIKRKTKPEWCEYGCECKVQYCFDPKNDKCPEDSRKDEVNPGHCSLDEKCEIWKCIDGIRCDNDTTV